MPFEITEEQNGKILDVRLTGKLVKEDYRKFVPAVERAVQQHGRIRMLVVMHDFHGETAGALWEDTKFGVNHFHDIERLAVVGEKKWQKAVTELCKPLTTATVRYFDGKELDVARAWVRGDDVGYEPNGNETVSRRNKNMKVATPAQSVTGKHVPTGTITNPELAQQLLDTLDKLFGLHAGFRPVHAKGLMCSGTFTPSPEAGLLTRAPHANKPSTPVTVRYSNSTGLPTVPDNDPERSSPRGMAIRFHLDEHVHTDIVAHSTDGFPVRTGEEFLEFLRAVVAIQSGQPQAMGSFLASHPSAKRFVETPKPIPTSFAREAFFAVTAFQFTNEAGESRHGRFRIRPEAGTEYLTNEEAAAKPENFLVDEIGPRLAKGPVKLGVFVQVAGPGDDVADASVAWPASRAEIPFGTIILTARVDDQTLDRRRIIFDPLPRVDGIDSAGDPLTQARSDVYLFSGRRRRAASGDGKH